MSGEFGFFCLPEEVDSLLRENLIQCKAQSYRALYKLNEYELIKTEIDFPHKINERELYLFQEDTSVLNVAELRGVVRLWLPFLKGEKLFMGTLSISKPRIIYNQSHYNSSRILYRSFVRLLKKHMDLGLFGVNTKTGGRNFYKDIGITERTKVEMAKNLKLKPVFGDDIIEFELPIV